MTKALLITYHNYNFPFDTFYHKVIYDYFIHSLPLWQDIFDKIYIIDSKWDFTDDEKKQLTDVKEAVFWKTLGDGHPIIQWPIYIPQVQEDCLMVIDNDVFIYDRKGIQSWFDLLKENDCVYVSTTTDILWQNHFLITKHLYKEYTSENCKNKNGVDCWDLIQKLKRQTWHIIL